MRKILLIILLLCANTVYATMDDLRKLFADGHQVTEQEIQQAITPGMDINRLDWAHTVPVAKALLDAGADVNITDRSHRTPLMDIMFNPHINDPKLVDLFVQYGADINAQDFNGETALHIVIARETNGSLEMVKALIKNGANLEVKDRYGNTPLAEIVGRSDENRVKDIAFERIELLLKSKANPNTMDNEGRTPLMRAKSEQIARALIEYGAKVNVKDNSGKTPLVHLIHDEALVKLLIEHGANIMVRDNDDNTLLMEAAKNGSSEVVELLIQKGCDINAINKHEKTVLDIAFEGGAPAKTIDILKKYGAISIVEIKKEIPDNGCPVDKPLRTEFEYHCLPCNVNSWNISHHDPYCEARCPNRTIWPGGLCALKECPKDAPLRRDDGICYPCDYDSPLAVANGEDCNRICPNRILEGSSCVLKECPEGSIRMEYGSCRTCQDFIENSSTVYPKTTEDCSRCPNLIAWGNECVPKECPGDWRDGRGRCGCEDVTILDVDDPDKCTLCGYKAFQSSKNSWRCRRW